MVRSELIARIQEEFPELSQADAELAVGTVFDTITDAMANDDRVEIRGFGSFTPKDRSGHKAWTGKGRQPNWVKDLLAAGKSLEDVAI